SEPRTLLRFELELRRGFDLDAIEDARDLARRALRSIGARLLVNALGHRLHVPRDAERRHRADDVPGRIEFPPVESVARGALVAVMVVVPTLADREERREHVIARLVDRLEPARAEHVVHRVDAER